QLRCGWRHSGHEVATAGAARGCPAPVRRTPALWIRLPDLDQWPQLEIELQHPRPTLVAEAADVVELSLLELPRADNHEIDARLEEDTRRTIDPTEAGQAIEPLPRLRKVVVEEPHDPVVVTRVAPELVQQERATLPCPVDRHALRAWPAAVCHLCDQPERVTRAHEQ